MWSYIKPFEAIFGKVSRTDNEPVTGGKVFTMRINKLEPNFSPFTS
jgi:hypothetical protein